MTTIADIRTIGITVHDREPDVGDLLEWDGVPPMFTFDDLDGHRFEIVEAA